MSHQHLDHLVLASPLLMHPKAVAQNQQHPHSRRENSLGNMSLASSSAAAVPTSSSGEMGGFGQQGFAASQASGVTMLRQFL